jgi:hypothetical protein
MVQGEEEGIGWIFPFLMRWVVWLIREEMGRRVGEKPAARRRLRKGERAGVLGVRKRAGVRDCREWWVKVVRALSGERGRKVMWGREGWERSFSMGKEGSAVRASWPMSRDGLWTCHRAVVSAHARVGVGEGSLAAVQARAAHLWGGGVGGRRERRAVNVGQRFWWKEARRRKGVEGVGLRGGGRELEGVGLGGGL